MSERKNIVMLTRWTLAVSLLAASVTAMLITNYHNRTYTMALGQFCQEVIDIQPEAEEALLSALKEFRLDPEYGRDFTSDENIILRYGYGQSLFIQPAGRYGRPFVMAGCLTGGLMFTFTILFWHKRNVDRINALTDYLEKVNTGTGGVLMQTDEDEFSKLQDEIYKTVTNLHQTRDEAIKAKENFAENLYNIAHQIKTPITSISLAAQMMQKEPSAEHLEQICGQVARLTHLEEGLLLLSRIDAGTLSMDRKETDVFTLLMLAVDNLQELLSEAGVIVDISESGAMIINVDPDWTMEAIMNLMKNCMEHTPAGGTVSCSYDQNPLYTQIRIWDHGEGFAKEDIPHLFERFYRGKNAGNGGIGIGLAFSKAIIESQNGTVSAYNLPNGGACYEIRFYSH